MSVELREVRQRIGSVRQIRRLTATLQRVAAARLQRQRGAVLALDRYWRRLAEALAAVLHGAPPQAHPLTRAPRGGVSCLVVFGAEHGLCGGYVGSLMDALQAWRIRQCRKAAQILAVGLSADRRARRQGWDVARAIPYPTAPKMARDGGPAGAPAAIRSVAEAVQDGFLRGEYCDVWLAYTRFQSPAVQKPVVELLLPLEDHAVPGHGLDRAIFEPDPAGMLAQLLPEYLVQTVFCAFLHSAASENAARQIAMGRATENAGAMLDELVTVFRRLRQESITTEMIELFGGNLEKPDETDGAKAVAPGPAPRLQPA